MLPSTKFAASETDNVPFATSNVTSTSTSGKPKRVALLSTETLCPDAGWTTTPASARSPTPTPSGETTSWSS